MRARRHGLPAAGRAERFAFPITDTPLPPLTETQARIIRRMFNQGALVERYFQRAGRAFAFVELALVISQSGDFTDKIRDSMAYVHG